MSEATKDVVYAESSTFVPAWIASGILGLAIGIGGTYLTMQIIRDNSNASSTAPTSGAPANPMPGGGGGMGGGMGGMGMGGMGMGGMGGGGGGGGGGRGAKLGLTALVGKLELLSRPDLKLNIELSADQAKALAEKLDAIHQAEKMTGEEAQSHVDVLEGILTEEQKSTLALIGMPRGRPAGGGGPGGGGPGGGGPGGGGMGMGMGMGMGGGGGGANDDNPFAPEADRKRIEDLLGRLSPAAADGSSAGTR